MSKWVCRIGVGGFLHAARADFLRRLERFEEASEAYRQALELARNPVEKESLARRLEELGAAGGSPAA